MASGQAIKAGEGFVSLFLDDGPLRRGLDLAAVRMKTWGKGLMALGAGIAATGFALAAPLAAAVAQFIPYEQALADLRAVANPTAEEFAMAKEKIEALALATGTAPTEVAQGFTELLRAGLDINSIIGGVGETLTKLSRVGEMSMKELAVVFSDVMSLFQRDGLTAVQVGDLLIRASDTSSIGLRQIAESMAAGGSSLAGYNQSLEDTAIAIAILGKSAIKGADAGTVLRTFFQRLSGVSEEGGDAAAEAVRELGLTFRDAEGHFLPLPRIMQNLQDAMGRFGPADQDRLRTMLGGARGERGISALLQQGAVGWNRYREAMMGSLSVDEKFSISMNTLGSQLKRFWVQVSLVAIAIGEALAPKIRAIIDFISPFILGARAIAQQLADWGPIIDTVITSIIGVGLGILAFGALVYALSLPLTIASSLIGLLTWSLGTLATLLGITTIAKLAWNAVVWLSSAGLSFFTGIVVSAASGFGLFSALMWIGAVAISVVKGLMAATTVVMAAFSGGVTLSAIATLVAKAAMWLYTGAATGATIATTAATAGINLLVGALVVLALALVAVPFVAIGASLAYVAYQFASVGANAFYMSGAIGNSASAITTAFGTAFSSIFDAGSSAFNSIADIVGKSWGTIWEAIKAGDWAMAFEQIKAAATVVWANIKFFGLTTFYAIKDAIIDAFSGAWRELKVGWVLMWAEMKAIALETLALAAEGVGMDERARGLRADAGIARAQGNQQAAEIREFGEVLNVPGRTPAEIAAIRERVEADALREQIAREQRGINLERDRGAAVAAGNEDLIRLQQLQWRDALERELADVGAPNPMAAAAAAQAAAAGDGDKGKFAVAGAFSREAISGFAGASETKGERIARETKDLIAAMERNIAGWRPVVMRG